MSPALFACAAALSLSQSSAPQPGDVHWLEGESAAFSEPMKAESWGQGALLSGGRWLTLAVGEGDVDQRFPTDGPSFTLAVPASSSGKRNLWARLGYEGARSPFSWRIGTGSWQRVEPTALTQDLAYLGEWVDAGWLKLGEAEVPPAGASIEFQIHKTKDSQGKTQRLLFGLDTLALAVGEFLPNGPYAPGQKRGHPDDAAAAETVFAVQDGPTSGRVETPLKGLWQVAREDEIMPGPVAAPMAAPPAKGLFWTGIQIPSDRNQSRPDLTFAHRLWFKTRVNVPLGSPAKGHFIHFPLNSLNTTVYVNGVFCGFNRNPFVPWQVDISKAVKPGENEVWVGIKDAWYGFSASPTNPLKLRRMFNLPPSFANRGFLDLAYPLWNAFQSGILETPTLVSTGPVYVEDVFIKPSVSKGRLDADYVFAGDGKFSLTLDVSREGAKAIEIGSGLIDPKTAESPFRIGVRWENPELWWPDQPTLYTLRTTLRSETGEVLDVHEETFGFREWGSKGKDFTLNGVVWRGWAELTGGDTPEQFLERYRRTDQRFMRLAGVSQGGGYKWKGLGWKEALDLFDRSGVVVRRSGLLDGQMIGHMAVENDPELRAKYGSEIKMELMENWIEQMAAQVKGERNHPSIHVWSLENEWLYINCINLYGGLMDEFEREVFRVSDRVRQVDPTRLTMVDGGGAGKAQGLPIHGDHYVYTNDPQAYPDLAYQAFPTGGGRGRWVWDQQRPRYLGEDFFASGINPSDYAWIQGESAFQGKAAAEKGYALVQKMLTEGYRWGGHFAAWHHWVGEEGGQYGKHTANRPIAAFFRERNWSFRSGEKVGRTFGVFNDGFSLRNIEWRISGIGTPLEGKVLLNPGDSLKTPLTLVMPSVTKRTEMPLSLVLTVDGKEVFRDQREVSILPDPPKITLKNQVAVYDPSGKVEPFLTSLGIKSFALASLDRLPSAATLLIIGPHALSAEQSRSSFLSAWAAPSRRVIILEQKTPLQGQGLPAVMEAQTQKGSFAFLEDPSHPVLAGLKDKDFFTWDKEVVYEAAYAKPQRGARSLIQAGSQLKLSLLAEIPAVDGLILAVQAKVGESLSTSAVARRLAANLILYADTYQRRQRPVAASVAGDPLLAQALNEIGVKKSVTDSPLTAIASPLSVAVVAATPANLKTLASRLDLVRKFTEGGGRLVLHGLTPEGLSDYSRIVGVDHLIRPFGREKVSLAVPRDPLASGISLGDVALLSSERMFGWNDDKFVSSDTFSYVVDIDDAAPFAALPIPELRLTVNGLVSADSWVYIYSFGLDSQKPEYAMTWTKPQTLTEIEWTGNGFYHLVTKFELVFDGKDRQVFDVLPNTQPQTLAIQPVRTASKVELRILDWQRVPSATQNVVGIDNIRLKVQRPAKFYDDVKPLLNIGALVRYPKGRGAIVLSNIKFLPAEDVPGNALRKRAVLAALLRNLEAEFEGAAAVIAGEALEYQPIDLSRQANQYRTERGWFGDSRLTFKDLPGGAQTLAGVRYQIHEFPTSPVPTVVMLGGEGIPNGLASSVTIPVGAKADALFFLLAARVDQPLSPEERNAGALPEMAEILVTYSDGATEIQPLVLGRDIADYRQSDPQGLPGAQLAWKRRWEGTELFAAAYSKQWNNPQPEMTITSVTLRYGKDKRGVPALLAVTAARRQAKK
jgi:hypothetical protein